MIKWALLMCTWGTVVPNYHCTQMPPGIVTDFGYSSGYYATLAEYQRNIAIYEAGARRTASDDVAKGILPPDFVPFSHSSNSCVPVAEDGTPPPAPKPHLVSGLR